MTPHASPSHNSNSPSTSSRRRPRVCVLGATLGTGNLGVDALGISAVQGLLAAMGDVEIVFQNWRHDRNVEIPIAQRKIVCKGLVVGSKESWRRRDGIRHMRALARWRKRWPWVRSVDAVSRALRRLASCDVALDVSAGDSFADIYGEEVFWYQTEIKELCLDLGVPLILMPQTYGPFHHDATAATAGSILSRSALACTREAEGRREIESLCGDLPVPPIVQTPDMACNLLPTETDLPAELSTGASDDTVIGLNVSGLLYFQCRDIGLETDYVELTRRLIDWALAKPNVKLMLIP
ncbi:MAG: polysaccharide pyruvyl transferase family protein, partial [Planctomycetales bacterium]|nr:polysaccharide pyruvyl transferase family protein [Planctomycetales bacterium]